MSESKQIFTLKQVVNSIKKTIEDRYQQAYWVKAEIHKLNLYPSGHAFPELVQKEDDKIVAQINGQIWKTNLQRINQNFIKVVKEPLKEGNTMLLQVRVVYHEIFGLSLQIQDIDPSFTLGELQKERDETLKKLQKEGVINANQHLEFPVLPKRIAIISADTSKGLSDFMKVLDHNAWGYRFFTMLFQAYLQGDMAVPSILEQLDKIEKVKHHFDAVVIVRGGGGEVGMSCYNNYTLCHKIATYSLPVLTGIGHSTNLTVAEMVAYRNAITPTELADFLIQSFHEFSVPVLEARKTILNYSMKLLQLHNQAFNSETKHFRNAAGLYLGKEKNLLTETVHHFRRNYSLTLVRNREYIATLGRSLQKESMDFLHEQRLSILDEKEELKRIIPSVILREQKNMEHMEAVIRILDPKQVLRRGYSIVTFEGKTLNKNNNPKISSTILVNSIDVQLEATVSKVILEK